MKIRFEPHVRPGSQSFGYRTRTVLVVDESVGHVYPPIWKGPLQRTQPLADPRFTDIYLLTAPHETNDHSPVLVPVEARDKELGF